MMMRQIFLLVVLLQFSNIALARMYQWVDPDTGTTQLSGKPPTWYRSEEPGPRILVYENGVIIDDTGISLSAAENEKLRQEALISVEIDRTAALAKLQQAKQQKATLDFQNRGKEPIEVIPESRAEPQAGDEVALPVDTGPTAEQLRALIEQYEQMKTQNAKELIEAAVPEIVGAPAGE